MAIAEQIEIFLQDPVMVAGTIGILVAGLIYQKKKDDSTLERINPESMKERLESIFRTPVIEQGSPIKDWVKMRGTSNTPRTIGLAVKAKDHTVTTLKPQEDDDGYSEEDVDGTTYAVIPGSSKLKVVPKYWLVKHLGVLKDKILQIHDIPADHILPGDDYIWLSHGTHMVKFNGIHRVLSMDGMNRVQELSFSKVHENYLETAQAIPEQYSTLNNRISGQIKMENIQSENIRKYMEGKNRSDKKNNMSD